MKGIVFRTQNILSQDLFCPIYLQKFVQCMEIQREVDDMISVLGEVCKGGYVLWILPVLREIAVDLGRE